MKKLFLLFTSLMYMSLWAQIPTIEPLIDYKKNTGFDESDIIKGYKWEAYTSHGVIIFGVNKSKADAEWVIEDFTKRNQKNAYKPIGHIIKEVEITSPGYFAKFKKKYPKGYKVLMQRDVIALRMIKISNLTEAANFIESVTKKNKDEAFQHVFNLSNNFRRYTIDY